jgi:hypothetical protein
MFSVMEEYRYRVRRIAIAQGLQRPTPPHSSSARGAASFRGQVEARLALRRPERRAERTSSCPGRPMPWRIDSASYARHR